MLEKGALATSAVVSVLYALCRNMQMRGPTNRIEESILPTCKTFEVALLPGTIKAIKYQR